MALAEVISSLVCRTITYRDRKGKSTAQAPAPLPAGHPKQPPQHPIAATALNLLCNSTFPKWQPRREPIEGTLVGFPGQGKPDRPVKGVIPGLSAPPVGLIVGRQGHFGA
jgi:hypothetical protein